MDNLLNYSLTDNPITSFLAWYEKASMVEQNASAMSVASHDHLNNRPNARYLLYKGITDNKIIFYTNYLSPKGHELTENPEVSLAFYWHISQKQVRIHGKATKMSRENSEKYFHSRDRESQIVSYLSNQSAVIEDIEALRLKYKVINEMFKGKPIPLPENWGGFLVEPYEFEFFLYGESRLNDRFQYLLKNQKWEVCRLQP